MKTNIVVPTPPNVKAKDAVPGYLYQYYNTIIMCFKPCGSHDKLKEYPFHFIRITEDASDNESMMMAGHENLIPLGEAYISNVKP